MRTTYISRRTIEQSNWKSGDALENPIFEPFKEFTYSEYIPIKSDYILVSTKFIFNNDDKEFYHWSLPTVLEYTNDIVRHSLKHFIRIFPFHQQTEV